MQGEGQENIEGSENKTTWHKLVMIRALKSFYNIITSHLITRRSTIIITIKTSYSELHPITRRSTTYNTITRRSTTYKIITRKSRRRGIPKEAVCCTINWSTGGRDPSLQSPEETMLI